MPPIDQTPSLPPQKEPVGPLIGVGIIVILTLFGALYFWGAVKNSQKNVPIQLPLITGDTSTTTAGTTTIL